MHFIDWLPSLSTTGLLLALLWLSRTAISNRLSQSIRHEYEEKIERIKSELRESEERLKSDLKAKETQIEVLRSGALSGLVSRQSLLDQKRIDAIERLWAGVVALGPAEVALAWMATIKFEAAAKESAKNPEFRKIFQAVGGSLDFEKVKAADVQLARPFVSELSWAIFSSYQAVCIHAVTQMLMLQHGVDMPSIVKVDSVNKLVRTVLPHQSDYLDRVGANGYHYLVDEMKSLLLSQLRKELGGEAVDHESLARSARILEQAEHLMRETHDSKIRSAHQ